MGVVTHGYCRTPTYNCWANVIGRCTNKRRPDYKNYGGRGIRVCESWLVFENFLADMGEKPDGMSIDRIDVYGDYCKENCRWASTDDQNNNRRDTLWVVYGGKSMSAKQASVILGIPYERIRWALERYQADWYQYATSVSAGVVQSNNTSGATGVSFHKASGRYHARIQRSGKVISLGYFDTLEEASIVRAAAEIGKGM